MVPVIYSDEFLLHDTGDFHPENPGRLSAIRQALLAAPWADRLKWQLPTPIEKRDVMPMVQTIHSERYVEAVRKLANRGGGYIDSETILSPRSFEVALLAVSAWLDGVDRVLQTGEPAFVLARPPGHHALPEIGMGFCIFGNAAIAAYYALQQPGVKRVAILDWDVHHGNGTQAIVEHHPQIAYCSLHESPHYPGTGDASEQGYHNNVLNIPMPAESILEDYELAFTRQVIPFLNQFQPDLLIVSAGYDANYDDPLSHTALRPKDYGILTHHCLQLTRKILFGLEGGYDLDALAQSVVETLAACLV